MYRRSQAQRAAVTAQPGAMGFIVWTGARDESPETRRVVQLFEVRQLVVDDVVQHGQRGEQQAPVEVQVAGAGAAPPAAFLLFDADATEGKAVRRVAVRDAFGEDDAGL